MSSLRNQFLGSIAVLTLGAVSASASSMNLYLYEDGSNVIFDYSGTVDLTGMAFLEDSIAPGFTAGFSPYTGYISSINGNYTFYTGTWTPAAYGTGTPYLGFNAPGAAAISGDTFGLTDDYLSVTTGYVSNSALSGQAVIFGTTIAGLGATAGVYTGVFGANDYTLTVTSPVPLPAGMVLLLSGLGALAATRRRKG